MTDYEQTLESLKLVRESAVWMVGVQTVLIGFLVNLLGARQLALSSGYIKGAAYAFAASIVCAGIVLGVIPWILARRRRAALVGVGGLSGLQYLAFIAGVVLLAIAVRQGEFGTL